MAGGRGSGQRAWDQGVYVFAGLGGAAHNRIQGIRIERNTFRLISTGVAAIDIYGSHGGPRIQSDRNEVSDVSIAGNRITIVPDRRGIEKVGAHAGAIMVAGGQGSRARVHDVRITDNRVDTPLIGIYLLGGAGGPHAWGTRFPAIGNAVFDVELRGNHVVRAPVDALLRYVPFHAELRARGITIVGGLGKARGNSVACVRLRNNRVAGRTDDVSVVANAGGASRNRASLGGC